MHAEFCKRYGRAPQWVARAPGRVNVIGEHTDYNDGFVLPMAIERFTTIVAAPNGSNTITLRSANVGETVTVDLSRPITVGSASHWANYPKGVLAGFLDSGYELSGFDALIDSDVPMGGGLSSSAALEVATATLLEAATGVTLDPVRKALLCQSAEHNYAGVRCGIMDQFVSTMGREGHLLLLDCRSQQAELVPMADPTVSVLIVNTNIKHQLSGSEYSVRRRQCEEAAKILKVASLRDVSSETLNDSRYAMDRTIFRRARHVVSEIARTLEAVQKIRERDWDSVGQLMYLSHESLRVDYEVSCPELDTVVEIARNIGPEGGVYGCRMTGGGFGGCTVALIKTDAEQDIMRKIAAEYRHATGIEASMFVSRPAQGARIENSSAITQPCSPARTAASTH